MRQSLNCIPLLNEARICTDLSRAWRGKSEPVAWLKGFPCEVASRNPSQTISCKLFYEIPWGAITWYNDVLNYEAIQTISGSLGGGQPLRAIARNMA